jgi:tRNA pseudouridine38-40 synthase
MCRGIVGTLVQVGQGKIPLDRMGDILASRDRRVAGMTAPAHGLVLWKVHYARSQKLRAGSENKKRSPAGDTPNLTANSDS